MTSRLNQAPAAPHQKRGGIVAGGLAKNQKPPAGDVNNKNRKVLGDIGNTVNGRATAELKPLPQVSRPVTRSFRAQLLRNAQLGAEVAVKKSTKPEPVVEEDGAIEPAKAKTAIDNTDVEVVTIRSSSKTTRSRKKATRSLTSVLTARSKAACGIPTTKTKAAVRDIDRQDANDQLAVVEYVEDLYTFYKLAEKESRPKNNYMESQVEINARMRSILVDWLMEVHQKFELMQETLYLTLYVMDKYLSMAVVRRRELQLVGISAMLVACKYEEIWAPEVNDFICICDRAYCREQILAMEKEILGKLEWCVTVPTPYVFLLRFLKAAASNKDTEHMAFFLTELGMMNYSILAYSPSMVAASAVYAARRTLKQEPHWDGTLERHTGFAGSELRECVKLLVGFHSTAGESKLKVVYSKYSSSQYGAVALKLPADVDDDVSASSSSTKE